jgi:ubiquinone/menaquinone biosynthesis C-methylase UbiE
MQPTYQEQWSNIDGMADPHAYVAIMSQFREAQPDDHFAKLSHFLDLKPGLQILEVCCGQGRVAQFVAQQVGDGHVVGIDASAAMLEAARHRPGVAELPLNFQQADARQLPFPDHSFDRVYSMYSLQIVPEAERALVEMIRVLRPGGRLYNVDYDFRCMMIESDMPALTKRIVAHFGEVGSNGEFIFSLPRRLKDLGIHQVQVEGLLELVNDEAFAKDPAFDYALYRLAYLEPLIADAQIAGIVSAAEAEQWLAEQDRRARDGRFYLSMPVYRMVAMKPEGV